MVFFFISVLFTLSIFIVYAEDGFECWAFTTAMVHNIVKSINTENVFLASKISVRLVYFWFLDNYMFNCAIYMHSYRIFCSIM